MKQSVLCILSACLLLLAGCRSSAAPPEEINPPDGSRAPYFSETHALAPDGRDSLCAVTVDRVLEHRYETTGYDSLVLQATVEEVFGGARSFSQGDSILVWVGIDDLRPFTYTAQEEVDQSVKELRRILEEADSLILYGLNVQPILLQNTPDCDLWLADTEGTSYSYVLWEPGKYRLDLPPSVRIPCLIDWGILPIREGVLDGEPLETVVETAGGEMAFDLDQALPLGGQHFKNGDAAGDVYEAMRIFTGALTQN